MREKRLSLTEVSVSTLPRFDLFRTQSLKITLSATSTTGEVKYVGGREAARGGRAAPQAD